MPPGSPWCCSRCRYAPARSPGANKHCVFDHPKGQGRETIVVELTVVNDGKPCVMQRRFKGQPATSLTIREGPAHGTLSRTRSAASYTFNPGFVGKDAFDVEWFGVGFGPNSKSRNIRTKVDVTLRAASDEPETQSRKPEMDSKKLEIESKKPQ